MGKKAGKKSGGGTAGGGGGFSTLDVDPRHVRYAHSKIKPHFSGCGRTIEQTLGEIREGKTRPSDLPMITVLLGPPDPAVDGGQQQQQQQCFFSLNNRRLFVFKACREEGLLGPSGLVRVRARALKAHERERYTVDRCSLQAKFLFAPKPATAAGPTRQDPDDDVPLVQPNPLPKGTPLSTTAEGVGARRRSSSPAAAAAAAAAAAVPVATASATISTALAGATTAEMAPAEEAATSVGETQDLPPENKEEGHECRSARSADSRDGGARRLEEEQRECQEEEEEDCCSSRIQGEARSGGQGAGERDPGIVRVTSSGQTAPRSKAEGTRDGKPVLPAESGSGGEETPDGTEGTAEALTSTSTQRRSKKKGGRRKQGEGGEGGGGEQRTRAGVLAEAAVEEMPGDVLRKQERSRNGRRRKAPMM